MAREVKAKARKKEAQKPLPLSACDEEDGKEGGREELGGNLFIWFPFSFPMRITY